MSTRARLLRRPAGPPPGMPRGGLVTAHHFYDPTESLQSLPGAYGTAYALQRGSTAGADTNDFSWVAGGPGASFVTDDYGMTEALPIVMAEALTLYIAGKFNGTTGTVLSLAAFVGDTHYKRILYNGSGKLKAASRAGGGEFTSTDLDVSTTEHTVLELKSDGTTLTLTNLTTGTSVTMASQKPTGACRLGVCVVPRETLAAIADAATVLGVYSYGRALSVSERARAKRAIQAFWAPKNVTVV